MIRKSLAKRIRNEIPEMKHTNIRQMIMKEHTERTVAVWLSAMVHVPLGQAPVPGEHFSMSPSADEQGVPAPDAGVVIAYFLSPQFD